MENKLTQTVKPTIYKILTVFDPTFDSEDTHVSKVFTSADIMEIFGVQPFNKEYATGENFMIEMRSKSIRTEYTDNKMCPLDIVAYHVIKDGIRQQGWERWEDHVMRKRFFVANQWIHNYRYGYIIGTSGPFMQLNGMSSEKIEGYKMWQECNFTES